MSLMRAPVLPGFARPLIFAHRGLSSEAPENTMAAFAAAAAAGVPGVELDVHRTRDGRLAVVHDSHLGRLAGVDATVGELCWADIERLDVGSWRGFAGERIPSLEEVFETHGRDFYFDVEIKSVQGGEPFEEEVVALVRRFGLQARCVLSSFDPFVVARSARAVRRETGMVRTACGLIYSSHESVPRFLRNGQGRLFSGCDFLKPHHAKMNPFGVWMNKTVQGYDLLPWTVDDPELARAVVRRGACGIISNSPHLLGQIA